jgi:hypothetical protein
MARILAEPEPLDLDLYYKDSLALTLTFNDVIVDSYKNRVKTPMDITGWSFAATWRPNKNDSRSVAWQFINRNNLAGTIVLEITSAMFTSMKAYSSSGVWDLQVTFPDTSTQTMLSGYVYAEMDVTWAKLLRLNQTQNRPLKLLLLRAFRGFPVHKVFRVLLGLLGLKAILLLAHKVIQVQKEIRDLKEFLDLQEQGYKAPKESLEILALKARKD